MTKIAKLKQLKRHTIIAGSICQEDDNYKEKEYDRELNRHLDVELPIELCEKDAEPSMPG